MSSKSPRRKFDAYVVAEAPAKNGGVSKGAIIAIAVIAGVAVVLAIVFAILYATSGNTLIQVTNDAYGGAKPAAVTTTTSAAHVAPSAMLAATSNEGLHASKSYMPEYSAPPMPGSMLGSVPGSTPAHFQPNTVVTLDDAYLGDGCRGVPIHQVTANEVLSYQNPGVPSFIASTDSTSLLAATDTKVVAGNPQTDFTDSFISSLQQFDPEGAATSEKAMTMVAPDRFHYSEAQEAATRKAATIQNMYLAGAADPSLEDIMSTTAPIVGTKALYEKAIRAQTELNNSMVLQTPMRFFNDPSPGLRPALPLPVLSPIPLEFDVTPGYELAFTLAQCSEQNKPITFEGY